MWIQSSATKSLVNFHTVRISTEDGISPIRRVVRPYQSKAATDWSQAARTPNRRVIMESRLEFAFFQRQQQFNRPRPLSSFNQLAKYNSKQ